MTSRWPRVLLETATPQAGLQAGDAFSLTPDHWLFVSAPILRTGIVLGLHSMIEGLTNGIAYRYSSADERFEELSYATGTQHWVPMRKTTLRVGDIDKYGAEWTLRFVDDGPAVTTVRRFGPHLCVNPTSTGYSDEFAASTWTLVRTDGTLGALQVRERLHISSGALTFREKQRAGPSLMMIPSMLRRLDPEIAKGIVAQMHEGQLASWIGFDGVVRNYDPTTSKHGSLPSLFWQLTRNAMTQTDADRIAARAEYDATRAATVDEVAAVMRALFAAEWAREQQLIEECGALARD